MIVNSGAQGIGEDILTEGETLEELMANIKEAVALHFDGIEPLPDMLLVSIANQRVQ
jgi:predicted RNase H-like HicB family nuclease